METWLLTKKTLLLQLVSLFLLLLRGVILSVNNVEPWPSCSLRCVYICWMVVGWCSSYPYWKKTACVQLVKWALSQQDKLWIQVKKSTQTHILTFSLVLFLTLSFSHFLKWGWEELAFVFSPLVTWAAGSCDLTWGVEHLLRERDPLFTDRENHCRQALGQQLEYSGLMGSPGQEHASTKGKKKPLHTLPLKLFLHFLA